MRGTRTENPGSTGGWTASKTEYDILGRVYRQTTPTEVSVSSPYDPEHWSPTGDDSAWHWNAKEYDWKGRVTRTIPTDSNGSDGKDTLMEYAGCGCAGGQVTTIKGPVTTAMDVHGEVQTDERRTQKVYEDVLGRVNQTELLDLNGASVYSSTYAHYNGRDQVIDTTAYEGTVSTSHPHQTTTMTYDGHGRLLRKSLPEESGDYPYTEYAYNADDTLATVTDARRMVKHFQYGHADDSGSSEYRNLMTQVSYTRPSGSTIELPVAVTFAYDAAGNRTSMTEASGGTGTTEFAYDSLSRVTSETKTFPSTWSLPDSPGSGSRTYTISYNYFLDGGVKEVVDPFSYHIYYTADKVGRMKTVTGTAWGAQSVTNYIDDVKYRAWGAEKETDFSNDLKMTQTFDDGLRPITHKIDRISSPNHTLFDKAYTYLPDGKIEHSTEATTIRLAHADEFERSYVYDFAARTRKARTGDEARGNEPHDPIPYHVDYEYDAFDHNTTREGSIYFGTNTDDSETQTWSTSTNRVSGWTYDAAGNTTYSENTSNDSSQTYTYNAAGTMNYARQDNTHSSTRTLDGMQRPAYIGQANGSDGLSNYFIYSTVFGKVLTETNATGGKDKTYVHDLGSKVIAVQQVTHYSQSSNVAEVRWEHTDPSGVSYLRSLYNGSFNSTEGAELDPLQRGIKMSTGESETTVGMLGYGVYDDKCKANPFTEKNCNAEASDEAAKRKVCEENWHGRWVNGRCEVTIHEFVEVVDDHRDEIPGFMDASQGRDLEPLPSNKDLRKRFVERLDANNGKCRDFLDAVRKQLKIGRTMEELFDQNAAKGGYVLADNLNGAKGKTPYGEKNSVGILGVNRQSDDTRKLWAVDVYVSVIFHELFHFAGVEGHERFARAAYASLSEEEQKNNPLPTKKDKSPGEDMDDARSRYFSKMINSYCRPPETGSSR